MYLFGEPLDFSKEVCWADWIFRWKKAVFVLSLWTNGRLGYITSLPALESTDAPGEHTLVFCRRFIRFAARFWPPKSLIWYTYQVGWKDLFNKCHLCVACTNKHMQLYRNEMKPLWSGFWRILCDCWPWFSRETYLFVADGKKELKESNVLSKAIIVTIHLILNNVSIACNCFCASCTSRIHENTTTSLLSLEKKLKIWTICHLVSISV